jgi:hypothetical protein
MVLSPENLLVQRVTRGFHPLRSVSDTALVTLRKWQQSDVARLFDCPCNPALMRGADTSQAARHDFSTFRDKALQQAHVPVRNRVNLFDAELADLLAAEKLASART